MGTLNYPVQEFGCFYGNPKPSLQAPTESTSLGRASTTLHGGSSVEKLPFNNSWQNIDPLVISLPAKRGDLPKLEDLGASTSPTICSKEPSASGFAQVMCDPSGLFLFAFPADAGTPACCAYPEMLLSSGSCSWSCRALKRLHSPRLPASEPVGSDSCCRVSTDGGCAPTISAPT